MNMCESYLTRTYLKVFEASSRRCTGITRMPLPYLREPYPVFQKDFGY